MIMKKKTGNPGFAIEKAIWNMMSAETERTNEAAKMD